jgi:hypothetical protein
MYRLFVGVVALLGFVLPVQAQTAALSTPPAMVSQLSQDELNAFGVRLANEAYAIMAHIGNPKSQTSGGPHQSNKNAVKNAKALFDDAVLIQNARLNYGLTKATFQPTYIDHTYVTDMHVNRGADDVLVLAFNAREPNRVDLSNATLMSGEAKPRLVVLRWNDQKKRWLVMSSSDFDTPKQAVCTSKPPHPEKKSRFKAADVALAKKLFEEMQDASFAGTEKSVQAKGFTYVMADGQRKVQDGPVRNRLQHRQTAMNVEAIRSGDLLVFRLDVVSAIAVDGNPHHKVEKPRLLTMIRGADGKWRMLAIGIFHLPATLAAGTPCVQPTAN